MTDRPIIFSAPMIRSLLDGRKTMTRRLESSPLAKTARGDRLWVREAFSEPNDQVTIYRANWHEDALARGLDGVPNTDAGIRWRPSIHMPRRVSRLTLDVTAVKIERLQEITEDDARAEGVLYVPGHGDLSPAELSADPGYSNYLNCRLGFWALWDTLHGPGAWAQNPEVVALTFAVHELNIDRASQ